MEKTTQKCHIMKTILKCGNYEKLIKMPFNQNESNCGSHQ